MPTEDERTLITIASEVELAEMSAIEAFEGLAVKILLV